MRISIGLLLLVSSALQCTAEIPSYFKEALSRFASDAPRGWAYTLTTTREGESSSERFDPSKPKGGEWTLLARDGRPPTAEETERYLRYKVSTTSPTARATFEKGDLDLGSFELLREDAQIAVFRGRFRDDLKEPLLSHLVIDLTILKSSPFVQAFTLRLAGPFSPALGVKMTDLEVAMEFSPAESDRPALPRASRSQFHGRLFFLKSIEEDVRISYTDFSPVKPHR